MFDLNRKVGLESQKSYAAKVRSGFFEKYLSGENVLDIGFAGHEGDGQPIVPNAIGVDINYPEYDGITLPFADGSQDAVYSSHCFEHIQDHVSALKDWFRVLKTGGFIVLIVPHKYLFECREEMPSIFNRDHKHFFTPASLMADIEKSLPTNSYRIRHMCDNDEGYDYSIMPQNGGIGCFEIEVVIEKIPPVSWTPDIGTARDYTASEFECTCERGNGWWIECCPKDVNGYWVFGPYTPLSKGKFVAEFILEAIWQDDSALKGTIMLDIARDMEPTGVELHLSGREGADMLRTGVLEVKFENDRHAALHEFRIWLSDQSAFDGKLRFHGLRLRMVNW